MLEDQSVTIRDRDTMEQDRIPITGLVDGALNISLAPNANDIEDAAGNDLANLTWSYTVALPADFGDAPAPYPTLRAQDGARHLPDGPTLGPARDCRRSGSVT